MMGTKSNILDTVFIVWISALGVSFLNFQPLLVGGFVSSVGISESGAGMIASANMLGMCVGLVLAITQIHKWRLPLVVLAALLLMSTGDFATAYVGSVESISVVRLIAGIGEGLALAAAVSAASALAQPDRAFALIMVGMSLYGMVGLFILPNIIQLIGLKGALASIAALSFLTIPFYRLFPTMRVDLNQRLGHFRELVSLPVVLILGSLLAFYIPNNGIWAYFERIGDSINLLPGDIGMALSAGYAASMFGGLTAAALGNRLGRQIPILSGLALIFFATITLYLAASLTAYVTAVTMFLGATGLVVPYYLGSLALLDPTGRLPIVGKLAIYIGMFLGPALAASVVGPGAYSTLLIASMALFVLATLLIVAAFLTGALALSRSVLTNVAVGAK